jgi:inhibitor of cysteine peptidase
VFKRIIIISLAGLLVVSPVEAMKIFNESANNRAMVIAKGEDFRVELKSNPTTGFRWEMGKLDRKKFKPVKSGYIPEKTGLIGSGGVEWWEIKAVGKGKGTVSLLYRRPWEKETPPLKTFQVNIRIK